MSKTFKPLIYGALGLASLALALRRRHGRRRKPENRWVLITGASTGIGRVLAESLARTGYRVIGTVRREADAETLRQAAPGIFPLLLDVADSDSLALAFPEVVALLKGQPLSALINNAGIGVIGPVEMLSRDELRRQFEVNVFGLVETTQTFLPLLAENAQVIQISSVAGETTIPFAGAYSASKHAVEALSDALRREWRLAGKGYELVVLQPGSIETPIWEKTQASFDPERYAQTPYAALSQFMYQRSLKATGRRARPEAVAAAVQKILSRSQNPPRVVVSGQPLQEVLIPRLLPDAWLDWVLNKILR